MTKCELNWINKDSCLDCLHEPLKYEFIPCPEESVNFDTTENLFFECDNLDALKYLQQTHSQKVKCIYIDPPYNTGKTRQYKDDFGDITGCKHSDWLNMMKPRLVLGRELLSEDGVIFISIDDNEQAQLKMLCDEVFGEENFDLLVWNKEAFGASGTLKQIKRFRNVHEYIAIIYNNKNLTCFNRISDARSDNKLCTANLVVNAEREKACHPNRYDIVSPNGTIFNRQWKFNKNVVDELINKNLIYWGKDGNKQPRIIIPTGDDRKVYSTSIINKGGTTVGRKELDSIIPNCEFDYPKNTSLISHLLTTSTYTSSFILDFFSGSGTTAHSIMKLNSEDGGKRKFILCQTPDPIDGEYSTIAEICKERMRRAGQKVLEEGKHKDIDVGFQVWKVRRKSND